MVIQQLFCHIRRITYVFLCHLYNLLGGVLVGVVDRFVGSLHSGTRRLVDNIWYNATSLTWPRGSPRFVFTDSSYVFIFIISKY